MKAKVKGAGGIDATLWPFVKEKFDLGLELRLPYEQEWTICLGFLAGKQYTFYNTNTHTLTQLSPVPGRIRSVDNQLLPRWRRQVADLVKSEPTMSVVPATMEEEDVKAAKVGDKVLKHFWQSNRMKKKQRQLAGWIFSTGNAFLDDRWNPKLGPVTVDEGGNIVYSGDVDCGVWSPYDVLVPFTTMGTNDLHGFPWMIKMKWRDLDYLAGNYKRGKEVKAETKPLPVADTSLVLGSLGGKAAAGKVEGAMLIELYVQPSQEFPKGMFVTAANGIILQKEEFPFVKYNMEHFKDIDVPGVFWGKATMKDAIGLQKTWNRTRSSIDEFNRTMAKGKWLDPRGSKIEVNPDDTHGERITYTPVMGLKPEHVTMKNMPASLEGMLSITRMSLDTLFSKHEVSQGTNKSDIRSGEMVALLLEQDAHGNIPTHALYEEALEEVMGRILRRIKEGYDSKRMISVVGRDGEFDVVSFQGADLRNSTDVKVKKQSSLPDSRIAREARIKDNFTQGIYGDPADPETRRHVANLLEDAPSNILFSETRADEQVARWENQMLMNLEDTTEFGNSHDNDAVHMKEHSLHRKKMDYQKIRISDPQMFGMLEMKFMTHEMFHQERMAEAREQMLEEQAMMKGGAR